MEAKSQGLRNGGGQGPTRRIGVDLMDEKAGRPPMLPVWFFIGVILLIYGLIILASGIAEFSHPPSTILANLHPAIWWGMLLVLLGAIYVYLFMPRKSQRQ